MKEPLLKHNTPDSVATYLSAIRDILPASDELLTRYEATKLRDYVAHLGRHHPPGFQDKQDFIAEFANYTRDALGDELGDIVFDELCETPAVVTTNHHGIDTFAQSTQTNLLFSLRTRSDGSQVRTIPVLACGSVPLNNLTYPRGLLIYATTAVFGATGLCRIPIFPDSQKRKLVSVAGPITAEMLGRSRLRVNRLFEEEKLARPLAAALDVVFNDLERIGQDFPDYSRQATVVNQHLWQRLFRTGSRQSDLVYIELEKIAGRLLESDLYDQSSIFHQLMFDPELRQQLIENLDGQRGCWQYENLLQRCSDFETGSQADSGATPGTMFFWGVDQKGKPVPLCVTDRISGGTAELRGVDDRGQVWCNPFTPEGIMQGLRDGRLLPSIFTSYLLISIARGVSCIGGYYQADYLPKMRNGVIDALSSNSRGTVKTHFIENLYPDLYLSGMQAVGLKTDDQIHPAGPLEIIASGGLNAQQYEQIGDISVLQAHIASLHDTIMDTVPDGVDFERANQEVARLVHDSVGEDIVTISMD